MTPADVLARVEAIRAVANDDEVAHGMEKELWHDALLAIAARECGEPAAVALAALTTGHIDFSRWYA